MSKLYSQMTLDDLRAERAKFLVSQKNAGGDYSWWGVQFQLNEVDKSTEELFKENVKHLYAEFGMKKVIEYLNVLYELELAQKDLAKKKAKL
jgi:hypothetical protein